MAYLSVNHSGMTYCTFQKSFWYDLPVRQIFWYDLPVMQSLWYDLIDSGKLLVMTYMSTVELFSMTFNCRFYLPDLAVFQTTVSIFPTGKPIRPTVSEFRRPI